MAEFTEKQIQRMIGDLKDEFGPDIATRELAILELEDMKRKGCALEFACRFDECHGCSIASECPVLTWGERHPEYANDELATKIKILEAGGKEAYKEKLKRQEEAKREAEQASDADKVNAIKKILARHENNLASNQQLVAISKIMSAKDKTTIKSIVSNEI